MKKEYVVIGETGDVSYSAKTDTAEKFSTFKAARKRAEDLAEFSPGEDIKIYELTAISRVPVRPVETSRAHPQEHYA